MPAIVSNRSSHSVSATWTRVFGQAMGRPRRAPATAISGSTSCSLVPTGGLADQLGFGNIHVPGVEATDGLPSIFLGFGAYTGGSTFKPLRYLDRNLQVTSSLAGRVGRHDLKGGIDVRRLRARADFSLFPTGSFFFGGPGQSLTADPDFGYFDPDAFYSNGGSDVADLLLGPAHHRDDGPAVHAAGDAQLGRARLCAGCVAGDESPHADVRRALRVPGAIRGSRRPVGQLRSREAEHVARRPRRELVRPGEPRSQQHRAARRLRLAIHRPHGSPRRLGLLLHPRERRPERRAHEELPVRGAGGHLQLALRAGCRSPMSSTPAIPRQTTADVPPGDAISDRRCAERPQSGVLPRRSVVSDGPRPAVQSGAATRAVAQRDRRGRLRRFGRPRYAVRRRQSQRQRQVVGQRREDRSAVRARQERVPFAAGQGHAALLARLSACWPPTRTARVSTTVRRRSTWDATTRRRRTRSISTRNGAPAANDIRHNFVGSFVYELPFCDPRPACCGPRSAGGR